MLHKLTCFGLGLLPHEHQLRECSMIDNVESCYINQFVYRKVSILSKKNQDCGFSSSLHLHYWHYLHVQVMPSCRRWSTVTMETVHVISHPRQLLRRKIFATKSCAVEDFLKQHRPLCFSFSVLPFRRKCVLFLFLDTCALGVSGRTFGKLMV